MTPDLTEIARHEIGHLIVALSLGYRVREISINPDKRALGGCQIESDSRHNLRAILISGEFLKEKAMIRVAGHLAICLHHRRQVEIKYHVAEWVLTRDQFADDPLEFDRILRRTWAILTKRENRVAAGHLLKALMKYKRLSGEQAQRIFDRTRIKQQKDNHAVSLFLNPLGSTRGSWTGNQSTGLFLHALDPLVVQSS